MKTQTIKKQKDIPKYLLGKTAGFTLVELIIVITILAILATIAFTSFRNYSWSARDGNRLATVKNIQSGLDLLSIKTWVYPEPENMVEITGSGMYLKQWFFWEGSQQAIKISGTVVDPLDEIEYIYSTNEDNTKYQLWSYLEENNSLSYFPQIYASNFDYSKRYFYTLWQKVWILLEEDNTPILKEKYSTWLNLEGNSNKFKVYFSNDNNSGSYIWNGDQLTQKIVEVQSQNTTPEEEPWETENLWSTYDCDNVTTESAFTFSNGMITWYDQNTWGLDVIIPCEINGETVTSIGGFAFGFKWLTSVNIPNTIIDIWNQAFYGNQLISVSIPNSITTIWLQVFASNQLTGITLPNSIISIWHWAFEQNLLTSISIPNNVTTIWASAFRNNKLTNVIILNTITNIWNQAFEQNLLTSISIPDSVSTLWYNVFRNNQLTSVVISNSVITIWNDAFNLNWPWKNSWNITDWTSGNGGTWNLDGTTWIKQN